MSCSRIGPGIAVAAALLLVAPRDRPGGGLGQACRGGSQAHERGDYTEAERLLRLALSEVEPLGKDDARTAGVLDDLARLLTDLSRFAEAESLATRALKINETESGRNSLEVNRNLDTLAGLYRAQGRFAESEPLYRRALAIVEASPDADVDDLTFSLQNLGCLLIDLRKDQEAERLHLRTLELLEKHTARTTTV